MAIMSAQCPCSHTEPQSLSYQDWQTNRALHPLALLPIFGERSGEVLTYLPAPGGQVGLSALAVRVVRPAPGRWNPGSLEYREFQGGPEGQEVQEGRADQGPCCVASCLGRDNGQGRAFILKYDKAMGYSKLSKPCKDGITDLYG